MASEVLCWVKLTNKSFFLTSPYTSNRWNILRLSSFWEWVEVDILKDARVVNGCPLSLSSFVEQYLEYFK